MNATTATLAFRALDAVRSQCDHARSEDGVGFSSYDADFARDLLEKGKRFGWTERQHAAAQRLARKYRKQVAKLDLDGTMPLDAILGEAAPVREEREAQARVELLIVVQKRTPKAIYADVLPCRGDFGKRLWFPLSQVEFTSGGAPSSPFDGEWSVTVPAWFADREGLRNL